MTRLLGPLGLRLAAGLVYVALLVLAGCAGLAPGPAEEDASGFLVRQPLLPLQASGMALAQNPPGMLPADLFLYASPHDDFVLRLSVPLLGTRSVELRLNPQEVLLVDYVRHLYRCEPNTPQTRQGLLGVDLSPWELHVLFTARLPWERFQRGRGRMDKAEAEFAAAGAQYVFQLGPKGLPKVWEKRVAGAVVLRVEYQTWLQVYHRGQTIALPQRIVVQDQNHRKLMLGLHQAALGPQAGDPPPPFLPDATWQQK